MEKLKELADEFGFGTAKYIMDADADQLAAGDDKSMPSHEAAAKSELV